MIPVHQADEILAASPLDLGLEQVGLHEAHGRVLGDSLCSDRDQPPFDRVTMDGIAVAHADIERGCHDFEVLGIHGAGQKPPRRDREEACFEVMTGCVMPEGCDTVIPVEEIEISNGRALLQVPDKIEKGQFIHTRASDYTSGTIQLDVGKRLDANDIAVAASLGKTHLQVAKQPKIAVISNGDELVEAGSTPEPWQIFRSNAFALRSQLALWGFGEADLFHLPDDAKIIAAELEKIVANHEVLILSGGVSKGRFDHIPGALENIGVEKRFHRIAQRPGKPMWYGTFQDKRIYALPGNPVSVAVCARRYVIPSLLASAGCDQAMSQDVRLGEDVHFKPSLTYFLPVKFGEAGNVTPTYINTSGDFSSLTGSAGFIQLEGEEKNDFLQGEVTTLYRWMP